MKKFSLLFSLCFLTLACNKKEATTVTSSEEIHNEQEPVKLHNSKGDTIEIQYVGAGDQVAVEISRNGESPTLLKAKTVSSTGNPIFAELEVPYSFEMGQEGVGGTIMDSLGQKEIYRPVSE